MEAKLKQAFAEIVGADITAITDATTPDDLEQWDSIAHLNLMVTLEETFDVSFTPDEMTAMCASFGAVKAVLRSKGVAV